MTISLETIATIWCYGFGAVAAILLFCVTALLAIDKVVELFKVKRAIIDWAWHRATERNKRIPGG